MIWLLFVLYILINFANCKKLSGLKFKLDLNYIKFLDNLKLNSTINLVNESINLKKSVFDINLQKADLILYTAESYKIKRKVTKDKNSFVELRVEDITIKARATFDVTAKLIIEIKDKIKDGPINLKIDFIQILFSFDENGLINIQFVNSKLSFLEIKFNNPVFNTSFKLMMMFKSMITGKLNDLIKDSLQNNINKLITNNNIFDIHKFNVKLNSTILDRPYMFNNSQVEDAIKLNFLDNNFLTDYNPLNIINEEKNLMTFGIDGSIITSNYNYSKLNNTDSMYFNYNNTGLGILVSDYFINTALNSLKLNNFFNVLVSKDTPNVNKLPFKINTVDIGKTLISELNEFYNNKELNCKLKISIPNTDDYNIKFITVFGRSLIESSFLLEILVDENNNNVYNKVISIKSSLDIRILISSDESTKEKIIIKFLSEELLNSDVIFSKIGKINTDNFNRITTSLLHAVFRMVGDLNLDINKDILKNYPIKISNLNIFKYIDGYNELSFDILNPTL